MRPLFNVVMRIFSSLLGLLVIAMGGIWMMQGLRIGPDAIMDSFMAGDISWTFYGAILLLFGIGQIIWSNTRQTSA